MRQDVHVDPATLTEDGEPGRSDLEDGTRVSAETSRRIACNASVVRVEEAADGGAPEVRPRTRVVPPSMRRALELRDRGCRFPGCGCRFTDAHHVRHWADGGPTELHNLVLLCKAHHRLLHEGGFRVRFERARPEEPVFSTTDGRDIPAVPPMIRLDGERVSAETRGKEKRWERDLPLAFYLEIFERL